MTHIVFNFPLTDSTFSLLATLFSQVRGRSRNDYRFFAFSACPVMDQACRKFW